MSTIFYHREVGNAMSNEELAAMIQSGEIVDANAHSKALRMLRAPKCSRALRAYL